jgi:N-acetylmuramoyl-L-alanine amidase
MEMKQSNIKHIVIHHSASKPSTTLEEITKWHKARGFNTVGYHKVIYDDGTIMNGRPETTVPASVKDHNKNTLAVCVCGNFEVDQPTNFQLISLELVIKEWRAKWPGATIICHRDLAPTLCPGKALYSWVKSKYPDI